MRPFPFFLTASACERNSSLSQLTILDCGATDALALEEILIGPRAAAGSPTTAAEDGQAGLHKESKMGNIGEKLSGANECCASPKRHQPPGTLGPQDKAKLIQSIEGIIRSTEACVRVPEWSMEWEHIPHHKPFAFSTIDLGNDDEGICITSDAAVHLEIGEVTDEQLLSGDFAIEAEISEMDTKQIKAKGRSPFLLCLCTSACRCLLVSPKAAGSFAALKASHPGRPVPNIHPLTPRLNVLFPLRPPHTCNCRLSVPFVSGARHVGLGAILSIDSYMLKQNMSEAEEDNSAKVISIPIEFLNGAVKGELRCPLVLTKKAAGAADAVSQ